MKKVLFLLAASALCASCEKAVFNDIEDEGGAEYPVYGNVKKFTFTLKGDFSDEWKPGGINTNRGVCLYLGRFWQSHD